MSEQADRPYVFVSRGDLTDLSADVVIIPTSTRLGGTGSVITAVKRRWGDHAVQEVIATARRRIIEGGDRKGHLKVGHCSGHLVNEGAAHLPQGVVLAATVEHTLKHDEIREAAKNAIGEARRLLIELRRTDSLGSQTTRLKEHWHPSTPTARNRALVAIASLATGEGGGGAEAASFAKAQVDGIFDELRDSDSFDVVIVAWDHDAHARFIAQRKLAQNAASDLASPSALAQVGKAIRSDACVLFVGAGLSAGVGLPGWNALIGEMEKELPAASKLDLPPPGSPKRNLVIAERYANSGSETQRHYKRIHEKYGQDATEKVSLSLAHYLLLALPIRYVVTTNYDGLVERTLERLRMPQLAVVKDAAVALSGEKHTVTVFKIHGHAGKDGAEDIVLTESEYKAFPKQHRAKAALLQALLLNHHFLFVGYSLGDQNLNAVHKRVAGMLDGKTRRAWVTSVSQTGTKPEKRAEARGVNAIRFTDSRALAIALDQLASTCVVPTRTLFANQHEPPSESVAGLHSALRLAGDEALRIAESESAPSMDLETAYQVLDDLASMGWRPTDHGTRYETWKRIALTAGQGTSLAVRAWRSAFGDAGTSEEAAYAAAQLAQALSNAALGGDGTPPEGNGTPT